jgi:hypothetical protein
MTSIYGKKRIATNLSTILSDLRAAAGPDVPIVGMTYYNAFAPLWFTDPATALFVGGRVDDFNAVLTSTYAAAGVPVADVAGAFENDIYPDSARTHRPRMTRSEFADQGIRR